MCDKLLTTRELADRLRVRPETVRQWARDGRIPSIRATARAMRYDLSAVLAALSPKAEASR